MIPETLLHPMVMAGGADEETAAALPVGDGDGGAKLEPLVREWLLDLQVLGRSPKTIDWYRKHMRGYFQERQVRTLGQLTATELKGYLAAIQARGLAENTVRGSFQTIKALANWAVREGYRVDSALLRVRAPRVAVKEMETYSNAQLETLLQAVPAGWPALAVQILLGTGMRLGELCALELEDVEDDGEAMFLKIRRGKGAKFRRVPVSHRLRRELLRYINRMRPDSPSPHLLLLRDARPVDVECVSDLFQRTRRRIGFRVHAHKFRHTFATEYLRNGGEIERLRRILGHTTYVMVMRYVHLDKGDLYRDFDLRSPF
ncbi:MAG TPA: tyrosine-type recombinase/integrase [Candidatus Dormibacteraeota bacterium]